MAARCLLGVVLLFTLAPAVFSQEGPKRSGGLPEGYFTEEQARAKGWLPKSPEIGPTVFTPAFFILAGGCLLGAVFYIRLTRRVIRAAIEARGGRLESVRSELIAARVTYRTKSGERRVVSCTVRFFRAFFADDDRPVVPPARGGP